MATSVCHTATSMSAATRRASGRPRSEAMTMTDVAPSRLTSAARFTAACPAPNRTR
jgi:hypothetical protein